MDQVKGFLYTIGLLFFSLLLLSGAVVTIQLSKFSSEQVSTLTKFERLESLDRSLQLTLREVFNVASGIKIENSTINRTVYIIDRLPMTPTNVTSFQQNMTSLKNYIVSLNTKEENITFYEDTFNTIITDLPLRIDPYNIYYTHSPDFGNNKIIVTLSQLDIHGYNITIKTSGAGAVGTWSPFVAGNLQVNIDVNSAASGYSSNKAFVSSSALSTHTLSNGITITINNGNLEITNPGAIVEVRTGIMLQDIYNQKVDVLYPGNLYNITLSNLSIAKTTSPLLRTFTMY